MASRNTRGSVSALPASAMTPGYLEQAREAAQRARERLENRPLPPKEGSLRLRNAACAIGCPDCLLECAVLPERAAWWAEEVARVEEALGFTLLHNGVAYPEPMGRA